MKHIQSINEWFGDKLKDKLKDYQFFGSDFIVKKKSEMDKFLQNISKVIKKENIEIKFELINHNIYSSSRNYSIVIDDVKYLFSNKLSNYFLYVYNILNNKEVKKDKIEISKENYYYIVKLYLDQENKKYSIEQATKKKEAENKIRKLPNLSDEGRAARKYNI
jgi:hypothetical protein